MEIRLINFFSSIYGLILEINLQTEEVKAVVLLVSLACHPRPGLKLELVARLEQEREELELVAMLEEVREERKSFFFPALIMKK